MSDDNSRIPELDILRGFCILGMILVHLQYDLEFFHGTSLPFRDLIHQTKKWKSPVYSSFRDLRYPGPCCYKKGAYGTCRRPPCELRQLLWGEWILGISHVRIWFGILHMLGFSIILYPLFYRLQSFSLLALGVLGVIFGILFEGISVSVPYLFPLGLCHIGFYAGIDFFPLFPGFGCFLIESALEKHFYPSRRSPFPSLDPGYPMLHFLMLIGRFSLPVYLLHQPVLLGILSFI